MFTLVYTREEKPVAPVLWEEVTSHREGELETSHASTARKLGQVAADTSGLPVQLIAAGKVRLVIEPGNGFRRPPGSRASAREDCKRGSGERCFCSACRAERKLQRA